MTVQDRLRGCILGGAIGDAWGSAFENLPLQKDDTLFYLSKPKAPEPKWAFSDDTQLTSITLEALSKTDNLTPDELAKHFVHYYKERKLSGLGASTLKSLTELQAGMHWSQVGRSGEFGAGNGAAMRIAPFAFWNEYSREQIREFCRITHRNDEAYVGALAVIFAIRQIFNQNWNGESPLIESIIPNLPDTKVRDRLIELNELDMSASIKEAARFGTNGYVVNSVPFSIFCASKVSNIGIESMFSEIIESGGDTDTNASIAGQIAGTFVGVNGLPENLISKLRTVSGFNWLAGILNDVNIN